MHCSAFVIDGRMRNSILIKPNRRRNKNAVWTVKRRRWRSFESLKYKLKRNGFLDYFIFFFRYSLMIQISTLPKV